MHSKTDIPTSDLPNLKTRHILRICLDTNIRRRLNKRGVRLVICSQKHSGAKELSKHVQ